MVNTAQSHSQLGGNKLLAKFQTIASAPSQSLLAKAFPAKPYVQPKTSILYKLRSSFNPENRQLLAQQSLTQQPLIQQSASDQPALTQLDALNVLDQVITEVENDAAQQNSPAVTFDGSLAQALPQATQQAIAASQPQIGGRAMAKESAVATMNLDQIVGDIAGAGGPSEVEPPKELEIPVEVESYLQQVENHQDQLPQEIVVADDGANIVTRPYPKQPVIVLPMTPEIEKVGASKPPSFSVRWLVEWSRKIMKMFEGMVIYRQDVVS
jgi:hypothetical protein